MSWPLHPVINIEYLIVWLSLEYVPVSLFLPDRVEVSVDHGEVVFAPLSDKPLPWLPSENEQFGYFDPSIVFRPKTNIATTFITGVEAVVCNDITNWIIAWVWVESYSQLEWCFIWVTATCWAISLRKQNHYFLDICYVVQFNINPVGRFFTRILICH